jgi:hypothetical protein
MAETRVVFSDASPLIALAAGGAFDLLRELFGTVTVTAAVRREVLAGKGRPGERELRAAIREGWVRIRRNPGPDSMLADLDDGEATTLAAASCADAPCLVLIDDPVARRRARQLGLSVTGTAGLLLAAKRRGLITAVRPLLEGLMRADFRHSAEVVTAVLEEAGEATRGEGIDRLRR